MIGSHVGHRLGTENALAVERAAVEEHLGEARVVHGSPDHASAPAFRFPLHARIVHLVAAAQHAIGRERLGHPALPRLVEDVEARVLHARVDRAWALVQDTAADTEGHLAVVTHGLVCRSLAARHLVLPPGEEAPTAWGNTALTIIDHPAPWRVRLLNCIAHLDDLEGQPIQDSGAV